MSPPQPTPARTATVDPPWPARAAVALLALLAALPVLYGVLVTDSGRDLSNAVAIALGGHWPLLGPSFNVIWSLGPAWFYLLALPMLVWPSLSAALLLLAALVAFKVPLAWWLGRRAAGWPAGLALAALVAVPGWSALAALTPTHASVVETAVLAALLLALRARQVGPGASLFPLGLVASLALHAHPTAIASLPLLLVMVWPVLRQRPWALLGLLLGGLLPVLPVLWYEVGRGLPQLSGTADYFGRSDYGARFAAMPRTAFGVLFGGEAFADRLLQQDAAPWPLLQLAVPLLALGALLGALRLAREGQRLALALWLYLLAALIFVLLLRHPMPPWMVHSLMPLKACALLGVLGLARGLHARSVLAALLAVLAASALGWQLAALEQARRSGELRVPVAWAVDVTGRAARGDDLRSYLPAFEQPRLARRLCRSGDDLRLHGDLAALLSMAEASASAIHCGANVPRIGGADGGRHRVGLPLALLARMGLEPDQRFAGFGLIQPAAVLHPAEGVPLRLDPEYLPDRLNRLRARGLQRIDLAFDCPRGEWLAVSDLGFSGNALRVSVTERERPRAADAQGWLTQAWRCAGEPIRLQGEALRAELVDVVRLR